MRLRYLALLSALLLCTLHLHAQRESIAGRIIDSESREALQKATLQLYRIGNKKDTTFVGGTLSNERGDFAFNNVSAGAYLLRISFLGYVEQKRDLTKTRGQALALGTIAMKPDAVLIDEAVVTANLPKMMIKDDTVVYNADAFRVPEGSVIEALVEVLPGAKVDDDGKISINGKDVKRFKLDGRDFMTGNNDAVMKNLPSYVIDQVKAYDEKSDLSRLTGVDDGNDDFVLEFVTKRSARKGLQANPDIGYGTDNRYGIRLTAMKPFGAMRYTFMGNANNVNDRNFSGRGGRGRGNNNGQRHTKASALDISYENDKNLKMSGRVTWNHSNTNNWNRTNSESFVNTRGGAFSNSVSQSYGRNNSWTGNMNLEWKIDSLTTLTFRPDINFSTSDNQNRSTSASFKADPFEHVSDPLSKEGLLDLSKDSLVVNSRENKSLGYSDNKELRSQLQVFRRLNSKGRNVAVSSNINYRDGNSQNANLSGVHLWLQKKRYLPEQDSTYQTNRYTTSDSRSYGFSLGATYTEPLYLFKKKETPADTLQQPQQRQRGPFGNRGRRMVGQEGIYLQLNYRFNYSYQKNDPQTYDLLGISEDEFNRALEDYRDFGFLPDDLERYHSDSLSRYSERSEYGHNVDLQLRFSREKYNMNIGVNIQPQRSHYIQQYLGKPIDTVRTVVNLTPTLNLRYRFDQQTNLQVQLRGQTQQPNITQLLNIYDDTNPLSVTMGNPGLKPSFTTNLSTNFQMQRKPTLVEDSLGFMVPKNQRNWSFSANSSFQRTTNSIGNIVTYEENTGRRISRPDNFDGNWSTNGGVTFYLGLDTLNRWDISGSLRGSYRHQVGFVNLDLDDTPDRNVTHSYNIEPSLSLSFRNKWLSISVNGQTNYARTQNQLQASRNLETWNFQYGGNTKITFPWGTNLSTDMHMHSKRGYSDATLNTNELLWNAQLSQSFLRGKKLTIMLQWYDILREQTNFSRTVNANGLRDQEVNAITSYAMIHVSYRLNFFGGSKNGDRNERDWDRDWDNERNGRNGGGRGGRNGGRRGFGGGFGGGRFNQ